MSLLTKEELEVRLEQIQQEKIDVIKKNKEPLKNYPEEV